MRPAGVMANHGELQCSYCGASNILNPKPDTFICAKNPNALKSESDITLTMTLKGEQYAQIIPINLPEGTPPENFLGAIKDSFKALSQSMIMRAEFTLFPDRYQLIDPEDPEKGHVIRPEFAAMRDAKPSKHFDKLLKGEGFLPKMAYYPNGPIPPGPIASEPYFETYGADLATSKTIQDTFIRWIAGKSSLFEPSEQFTKLYEAGLAVEFIESELSYAEFIKLIEQRSETAPIDENDKDDKIL